MLLKTTNSGYNGFSMSNRAVAAYSNGEKPKSKWTKKAMINEIMDHCDTYDVAFTLDLKKMKKEEIFNQFFRYSSYHHTSKFCNVTEFYAMDVKEVEEYTRPFTQEELEEQAKQDAIFQMEMESKRLERLLEEKAKLEFYKAYGVEPTCGLAYILMGHELETKEGKNGDTLYFTNAWIYESKLYSGRLDPVGYDEKPTEKGLAFLNEWKSKHHFPWGYADYSKLETVNKDIEYILNKYPHMKGGK